MTRVDRLSEYWTTAIAARFWLIASLFYLGTLLSNLAFISGGECGFAFIAGAQPLFVTIIILLLVFEWWAYRRYATSMTRRAGLGLLVAHMVWFETAVALDCTASAMVLYPLAPFLAYLLMNQWIAIALALVYSIWFAVYFHVFRVDPLGDYLFRTVVFGLGMILSLAMASVVKGVLISQAMERRLHSELVTAHRKLEAYAADVKELGAAEERNRLARDIHDSVGHYLAAVTVQLEKALVFRTSDPAASERAILDAQQAARDALRDVRQSVAALRRSAEFFSLRAALTDLVRNTSNDRLSVDLNIAGSESGYAGSALIALYRIAQQGLTNIQQHAAAGRAVITLELGDEKASLTVHDDGRGFAVTEPEPSPREHLGLNGMRERLRLVGGELTIESGPRTGTTLIAVIPKQAQNLDQALA